MYGADVTAKQSYALNRKWTSPLGIKVHQTIKIFNHYQVNGSWWNKEKPSTDYSVKLEVDNRILSPDSSS